MRSPISELWMQFYEFYSIESVWVLYIIRKLYLYTYLQHNTSNWDRKHLITNIAQRFLILLCAFRYFPLKNMVFTIYIDTFYLILSSSLYCSYKIIKKTEWNQQSIVCYKENKIVSDRTLYRVLTVTGRNFEVKKKKMCSTFILCITNNYT